MNVSDTLVQRYRELRREAEGAVLLMQVGAFMQVMDEDAGGMLGWHHSRFPIAAAVRIAGQDLAGLERRLRHFARPPNVRAVEHCCLR